MLEKLFIPLDWSYIKVEKKLKDDMEKMRK